MVVLRKTPKESKPVTLEELIAYLLLSKIDYNTIMTADFNFINKIAQRVNFLRNPDAKEEQEQHRLTSQELQNFVVPNAEDMSDEQLKESRTKMYNYLH